MEKQSRIDQYVWYTIRLLEQLDFWSTFLAEPAYLQFLFDLLK